MPSGSIVLSLTLHALILVSLGGLAVVTQQEKKDSFDAAPQVRSMPDEVVPPEDPEVPPPMHTASGEIPDSPNTLGGGSSEVAESELLNASDSSAISVLALKNSSVSLSSLNGSPSGKGTRGLGGRGEGSGRGNGSGILGGRQMFGTKIQSEKLIVLIDVSGSMHPVLEKVVDEALSNFPSASFYLAEGCGSFFGSNTSRSPDAKSHRVDKQQFSQKGLWKKLKDYPYFTDAAQAFEYITDETDEKTAIYWLSDFQDEFTGWDNYGDKILKKKSVLYIHSVSREPNDDISSTVRQSGGEIILKPVN